jgi:quinol monooxygenase YgiN
MPIIVAGRIYVKPAQRDDFLAGSRSAMELARRTKGCDDFVVAPDPLDSSRVNVFEIWRSRDQVTAFRESGPYDGLSALIERADVREYDA